MIVKHLIALFVAFSVALNVHGNEIHIVDDNLRASINERLDIPPSEPITQQDILRLVHLSAYNRGIVDLSGLQAAQNLGYLALGQNPIIDLSPVAGLTNLRGLVLPDCDITDIRPLANLIHLEELNLRRNPISDITPLAPLATLKYLDLGHCEIIDISILSQLNRLHTLQLYDNRIGDVRPLSQLTSLRKLEIQDNLILDHSPLDMLSLDVYQYDQVCDVPPMPLEPRLANKTYPAVATAFSGYSWPPVKNRPELSAAENIALHDLWIHGDEFELDLRDIGNTVTLSGDMNEAIRRRDELRELNPNLVVLMAMPYGDATLDRFPADSSYWIRNDDGTIYVPYDDHAGVFKTNHGLLDFTHPAVQEWTVQMAVAVSKCGLYDGIHFDSWNENRPIIVGHDTEGNVYPFRSLESEVRARVNIVRRIRAQTRDNFVITGNTNHRIIPRTGPYLNAGYMEADWPREGYRLRLKNSLTWLEANLREPQFNILEGKTIPNEPRNSPDNLRWVRELTTLSLTHSNGYVSHNNPHDERRDWYDFWDADLGRPVGEKGQLYQEIDGLYIREFTNGWAVYNHSGDSRVITLPEETKGVASQLERFSHTLANRDGEMYLRVTPANPADVNEDGVVNIFDLTLVAQALGTDGARGDVNGDGVVNVFDLVFVANQF